MFDKKSVKAYRYIPKRQFRTVEQIKKELLEHPDVVSVTLMTVQDLQQMEQKQKKEQHENQSRD